MKKNVLLVATAAVLLGLTACNNKKQTEQTAQENQTEQCGTACCKVLTVDSLLNNAEKLTGTEIELEGLCTHVCAHGATKMFLMGSDDTKTIRVEAGKLGSFDNACINNIVKLKGTLLEERIDEAYLQNWENELKAGEAEKHGEGEGGCSTEKNARGETSNDTYKRIEDFRKRIADRKAETGKEYLSFYYLEASEYEIEE